MDYDNTWDDNDDTDAVNMAPEVSAATIAAGRTGAIPLVPDADNVVMLPPGASLDDLEVRGRDIVVELPDGRIFVIPDGAVFVPVIVVEGVAVPPLNLAAYLTGDEPQPAAGAPQSSGGNFADSVTPIQPGFGLGDLLP